MKLGIVGVGVVGGAIKKYYSEAGRGFEVLAYDRDSSRSTHEFEDLKECEIVFVSVPTLTRDDGTQDLFPLSTVFENFKQMKFRGVIVHKCTVVPGTTRYFSDKYPELRIVHCPEFLTERNAFNDYKHAKAILLSGAPKDTCEVEGIIENKVIHTYPDYESTEIAKYVHNCFLATKVSFFNEMFDVCKRFNVSYDEMIDGLMWMDGIGTSHLQVPGPDGKRGFGGMCFPKDTRAFINIMSLKGIWLETLAGAIKANKKVRGE